MATIKFTGIDKYIQQLERLTNKSDDIIRRTLYKGAKQVADTMAWEIASLQVDDSPIRKDVIRNGPRSAQKAGLMRSFGITPMRNKNGTLDVKLGFDGYNDLKTDRWPNGQPNSMVARTVESGTSWMRKQPFVTRAVNLSKAAALEVMQQEFEKKIREYTEE